MPCGLRHTRYLLSHNLFQSGSLPNTCYRKQIDKIRDFLRYERRCGYVKELKKCIRGKCIFESHIKAWVCVGVRSKWTVSGNLRSLAMLMSDLNPLNFKPPCHNMWNVIWWPFHSDIDECTEPDHGCSQLCNNTKGSYNCFCLKGFFLRNDNKTCVGKFVKVDFIMVE